MQAYNVHTHIFTMNNAPRKFLELYMHPIAASTVDRITNTQVGSFLVRHGLKLFGGPGGKRYAKFLEIGKSKNQNDVLRHLMGQYADSSMKIVALTLYMEKMGAEASMSGFEGQIEEVLALKKRYPDRLLPFLSLDPRWKATGEEIRDTVAAYFGKKLQVNGTREVFPFAGLKLYPSTGYYAFDEKLKPVMEWAALHRVPVMTHCSYLGGIFNNDERHVKASLKPYDPYASSYYNSPSYQQVHKKTRVNNLSSCSYFLEPYAYESMIRYFAGKGTPLKLCFAHFGGDEHMLLEHAKETKPGKYFGVQVDKNWCRQIRELMAKYPGVYADVSYSLSNEKTHPFIFEELRNPDYADRILFGTDYFMTERRQEENVTYSKFRETALKEQTPGHNNAWERIAMRNVEEYLASEFYPG